MYFTEMLKQNVGAD